MKYYLLRSKFVESKSERYIRYVLDLYYAMNDYTSYSTPSHSILRANPLSPFGSQESTRLLDGKRSVSFYVSKCMQHLAVRVRN